VAHARLLVPIYDLLVLWRISDTAAEHVVEDQTGPVLFLLWVVFFPAAMYLMQGRNQQEGGVNRGQTAPARAAAAHSNCLTS